MSIVYSFTSIESVDCFEQTVLNSNSWYQVTAHLIYDLVSFNKRTFLHATPPHPDKQSTNLSLPSQFLLVRI